mmetsp:Transcript_3980/g.6071  ORF Transcript_3980/g.6071 Transcript_3980/m.6071 type:complete len:155 (+) Transcript_3980:60-524(+)|eukprot:CAMPEP_0195288046 /NCGR_PEP_ID=MMETSP0707-20130614/4865_1 /TAXON_ID=33640 /ORGANISM="Asterionellopsis glacialis, Strain CCMP134" /LENGTH=154 /DNA_ID=CAMNT_0040347865 /DNA_START=39 /DNA_END=503 /DNA_ORIENTATION=-
MSAPWSNTSSNNKASPSSPSNNSHVNPLGQSYEESYELDEPTKASRWNTDNSSNRGRQIGGAAAAGGLAGLVLVGPIVAVAGAIGGAVAATSKGVTGALARGAGEGMASAGDEIKKVEDKTHLGAKSVNGLRTSVKWVSSKFDRKKNQSSNDED